MAIIKYFRKPIFITTLICVIFFYSFKSVLKKNDSVKSLITENSISFINGSICSCPAKTGNGKYYSCIIKLKEVGNGSFYSSAKGKLKIYIPSDIVEVNFPGKLYSKQNIKKNNKIFLFENGGNYSFSGKNLSQGFFINDYIAGKWPNKLLGKISYFRALCRLYFKRLMYKWGEGGGLLLSLLSGSREYINYETATAFKNAGLSHILALSGMHLSMFSLIAVFLGNKIGRKKLSYIIRIVFLSIFVWFAGITPSLMRAFICSIMIIIATIAGVEKPDNFIILCFSFILQSILRPDDIYNIGFILSYGALAGILLTGKIWYMLLVKIIPTSLSSSLSASVGAQLFTAPITLRTFGTFCPIGIIANIIISPLITIYIYTGLVFIFITIAFPALGKYSGIFINLQYNIIKNLVIFFSHAPILSL